VIDPLAADLELPQCPYRKLIGTARFSCEAAGGATVTVSDCRACSIPAAVGHKDACLYLIPLWHEGRSCFACRWFFSSAVEPVVDDWRRLCFCSYWFPRGNDERHVLKATANRRMHYLEALRRDAPGNVSRMPMPSIDSTAEHSIRATMRAALAAIWRRLNGERRKGSADR
jgi:hypothetical protein